MFKIFIIMLQVAEVKNVFLQWPNIVLNTLYQSKFKTISEPSCKGPYLNLARKSICLQLIFFPFSTFLVLYTIEPHH